MAPHISLLSTYYENAGDDLIREGVQYQLCSALGKEPRWRHVSKSNLLSILMPRSWWTHAPVHRMSAKQQRFIKRTWAVLESAPLGWLDKVRNTEAFVIAGTPIFYFIGENSFVEVEASYASDWPTEILTKRLEMAQAPRFLALGVGSLYDGDPEEALSKHPTAADYIRRFVKRSTLITTRDEATARLLWAACPEQEGKVIRSICPSLWAQKRFRVPELISPKHVSISFSVESVNWDLTMPRQQVIEARTRAFEWVVTYLKERQYEIGLLAHNQFDVVIQKEMAKRFGLRPPVILNARRLMEEVYKSELVVTWRLHGALAALSAARRTLLFKTDDRWPTAAEIGACVLDDRELTQAQLIEALDRLCRDAIPGVAERTAKIDARRFAEFEKLKSPLREAFA